MTFGWRAGVTTMVLGSAVMTMSAANIGVSLIGTGFIPGNALDRSGLAGTPICQRDDTAVCIDHATLGGLGSAVTYTGSDGVYLAAPDRGPFDGRTDVPYRDRVHLLRISLDVKTSFPNIKTTLLDTRLLKDERHQPLVGDAYAFDTASPLDTRTQPETDLQDRSRHAGPDRRVGNRESAGGRA